MKKEAPKTLDSMKRSKKYSFRESKTFDVPRIPSGIFSLDYAIGGGIGINTSSSFFGPNNGGKSLCSNKIISSAQNLCFSCFQYLWDCNCGEQTPKKVVLVDVEGFDDEWVEYLGVDTENLFIPDDVEYGEQAVDYIYECLLAEDCGLVVLDSLARVIPEKEIVESAFQAQVGDRSKLHARLMNKVKSAFLTQRRKGINTAFLCTNQVRANIGSFGQQGEEVTGGNASKHEFHLNVRLSSIKPEAELVDKESGLPLYGKFKVNLLSPAAKFKLFVLAGAAEFYISLRKNAGIPKGFAKDYKTVYEYLKSEGFIGSNWDNKFDGTKYKSKEEMINYWIEDIQYYSSLKKKLVEYFVKKEKSIEM